jgi:enterochelin esterase-like enzyme
VVDAVLAAQRFPEAFHLVAMQSHAFVDDVIYETYRSTDLLPLKLFLGTGYPWDLDELR